MGAKHLRIGWFRGPSAAARTYLENSLEKLPLWESIQHHIMYIFIIVLYCSYLWEGRDIVQSTVMDIMYTFIIVHCSYLWEGQNIVKSTVLDMFTIKIVLYYIYL